jgi:hypothetical protein
MRAENLCNRVFSVFIALLAGYQGVHHDFGALAVGMFLRTEFVPGATMFAKNFLV